MLKSVIRPAAAAVSALALMAAPAAAQTGFLYTVVVPAGEFGSAAFLKELLAVLASAKAFCGGLGDAAYRVDCLAERFEAAAADIPQGTDYDEVRAVLQDTSGKMARLARQNRDTGRPRAHAARPGVPEDRTARPLTPVAPAAQAAVNRQAAAILEEAQTLLLRSAEAAQERHSQYAQIAAALDSNKVLLRS